LSLAVDFFPLVLSVMCDMASQTTACCQVNTLVLSCVSNRVKEGYNAQVLANILTACVLVNTPVSICTKNVETCLPKWIPLYTSLMMKQN